MDQFNQTTSQPDEPTLAVSCLELAIGMVCYGMEQAGRQVIFYSLKNCVMDSKVCVFS